MEKKKKIEELSGSFPVIFSPSGEKPSDYVMEMIKEKTLKFNSIYVIYNPDCGCEIDQFVLLDRYPMSKKIHFFCPKCHTGCLLEISDPILFHYPLQNLDLTREELRDGVIMDSYQKEYLESYANEIAQKLS